LKKRVSVLFLSFLLVVSLMQCYASAEKQTKQEEDAIVMKSENSSSDMLTIQQYSSYLGGSASDQLKSFVFVEPNIVYLAGTTFSTDFPVISWYQDTNAGGSDCFIMKVDIETGSIIYSTYIGGSSTDDLWDITVDEDGNVYATGSTFSTDFPVVNPYQGGIGSIHNSDAFLFKLNSNGDDLLYSTYYGFTSSIEAGISIDVDSSDNAYVFGGIAGGGIELKGNPIDDERVLDECFLLKFNSTGNGVDYASYIGGSDADYASTIYVDDDGNVFLIGYTMSDDLPGLSGYDTSFNGATDCFVIKLNSTLSGYEYCSYIGGAGIDKGVSATVDSSGSVYVTGSTSSTAFPTVDAYDDEIGGAIDCFVCVMEPDGSSLSYSTYVGGSGVDYGFGIAISSDEAVLVTGYTPSSDFPTTSGADSSLSGETDCFVSKLNLSTSALDYSTYLGGSGDDTGIGVAFGTDETMIVAGSTDSEDFLSGTSHIGDSDWFLYEIPKPQDPGGLGVNLILVVGLGVGGVVIIAAIVCLRRR